MSDIYLTLLRRIESVTTWVPLGTDVMKAARNDKGASYETIARAVPVSSKTYERWEKRGAVPNDALHAVARALDLKIERAERVSITLPAEPGDEAEPAAGASGGTAGFDDARLERMEGQIAEVRTLVLELLGRPGAPTERQSARRRSA